MEVGSTGGVTLDCMKISVSVQLPFPRALVYPTYRDRLSEIVQSMPDLHQVQLKSSRRSQQQGQVHYVNEWRGSGEIPAIARPFLNEDLLSWTDEATWNDASFSTDWQTRTHAFTEAVHCGGQNVFLEDATGTLIESQGELTIDPSQLKGVPFFLAGTIAALLEDYLGKKVAPNFIQINQGVQRYLETHQ